MSDEQQNDNKINVSLETAYALACQEIGESLVREKVLKATVEAQARRIADLEAAAKGEEVAELVDKSGGADADLDHNQGQRPPDGGLAPPSPQG